MGKKTPAGARYAEDANYWTTKVSPYISQGEIYAMLKTFGADNMQMTMAQSPGDGGDALLVRFGWKDESYRLAFIPLECRNPDNERSFGNERRTNREQALYQMARVAVNGVKAVLTMAETLPAGLVSFKELPGVGHYPDGLPYTVGELSMSELTAALPRMELAKSRLLSAPRDESVVEGEYAES